MKNGPSREEVQREIVRQADAMGINPALALGLFFRESSFRWDALSSAGAMGVAQLMPGTAKEWGVNPWDYRQNIRGGLLELQRLSRRFNGDLHRMLRHYGGFVTRDPTRYIAAVMQSILEYTQINIVITLSSSDLRRLKGN